MMKLALVVIAVIVFSGCKSDTTGLPAGMEFVSIPSGSFLIGSPDSEEGLQTDQNSRLSVHIDSFQLMTTEVTQGMWEEVMGTNVDEMLVQAEFDLGFTGVGYDYPMYYVSWEDCKAFIAALNELDDGHIYRLPTTEEWEYAARAGTTTHYYWGDDPDELEIGTYAWYIGNANLSAHPVGTREPNQWGLYDMSGNVYEWCEDSYQDNTDPGAVTGVSDTGSGVFRVLRGGCWFDEARQCRSSFFCVNRLDDRLPFVGFRLARS